MVVRNQWPGDSRLSNMADCFEPPLDSDSNVRPTSTLQCKSLIPVTKDNQVQECSDPESAKVNSLRNGADSSTVSEHNKLSLSLLNPESLDLDVLDLSSIQTSVPSESKEIRSTSWEAFEFEKNLTKTEPVSDAGLNIENISKEKVKREDSMKQPVVFEIGVNCDELQAMPKKAKSNLQEAFLQFRKKRQDDIKQERRRRDAILESNADPVRMEELRAKVIKQAKKYFGVPYARKYWQADTPEYKSPIFLDCCGLVRQVIRDLKNDLGFRLGPWNQSYMFDTLPVSLSKDQMKPGDLVFMTGEYVNAKSKKQRHNMLHVEIWLGEGNKTIGSRWNNGKVQVFDSYKFKPKSFRSEQYIFKSIDTWLMGICQSYCPKHPWRISKYNPSTKSIFNAEETIEDEKADFDSDDENVKSENVNNDGGLKQGSGDQISDALKVEHLQQEELNLNLESGKTTPLSQVTTLTRETTARSSYSAKKWRNSLKNRLAKNTKGRGESSGGKRTATPLDPSQIDVKLAQHASKLITGDHDMFEKLQSGRSKSSSAVSKGKKPILVKSATSPDLKKAAAHGPRKKGRGSRKSLERLEQLAVAKVQSCNDHEIEYIATGLPRRVGVINSNYWMSSKDREKRVMNEQNNLQPNQRGPAWNLHKTQGHPLLSVVGSQDLFLPKTKSCPNLQMSAVNPVVRTSANFSSMGRQGEGHQGGAGESLVKIPSSNLFRVRYSEEKHSEDLYESSDNEFDVPEFGNKQDLAPLEDCLLVCKSPRRPDVAQLKRPGSLSSKGVTLSARSRSLANTPCEETGNLGRISKINKDQFSCIKEESGTEISGLTTMSKNRLVPTTKTRLEGVEARKQDDLEQSPMVFLPGYADSTRLSKLKDIPDDGSVKVTAGTWSNVSSLEDWGTKTDKIAGELGRFCFDQEVVDEEDELAMAETSFTSDCSFSDVDFLEDGRSLSGLVLNTDTSLASGQCPDEDLSDVDTDDDLHSGIEATVLNHRHLAVSTGLNFMESQHFNPAWDWLFSASENPPGNLNNNSSVDWKQDMYFEHPETKVLSQGPDCNVPRSNSLPPIVSSWMATEVGEIPLKTGIHSLAVPPGELDIVDTDSVQVAPPSRIDWQRQSFSTTSQTVDKDSRPQNPYKDSRGSMDLLTYYVMNQRPKNGDDASSTTTGFNLCRKHCRGVYSPSGLDSSLGSSSIVSEDLASLKEAYQQRHCTDYLNVSCEGWQLRDKPLLTEESWSSPKRKASQHRPENFGSAPSLREKKSVVKELKDCPGSQCFNEAMKSYFAGYESGEEDDVKPKLDSEDKKIIRPVIKQHLSTLTKQASQLYNLHYNDSDPDEDDYSNDDDLKEPRGSPACTSLSTPVLKQRNSFSSGAASSQNVKKSAGTNGANGGEGKGESGAGGGAGKGESEEKPQGVTDQTGGGDESMKGKGGGGGGGGGGGKKPQGRPSKLPQCCLPNNMQPTFYIGGGNGIALVEGPLLGLGWKRITDKHDERYRLKWVENKSRINYIAFKEGEQLVNHIPNCKLLTNKLGLLCSLQEYERVTLLTKGRLPRMKMSDFVPETYKLDERVDREKFLNEYKDGETWICKPTSLNQGKGIFLLRSRDEINQLLSEREAKVQTKAMARQPLMRIVQRYLNNPLLLEGRKFDIRSYMFIASTVPFLVLYHKGYVRLSCQKYNKDDTNLTTHLTNQFVQKKDPNYKDNKEDTAWTMDKLNDYINDNVSKEKGLEKDWVYGSLTKQMQRISLHCFNSVKHKLQCKVGYFDLYGLDFMVDSDMKVWLIEINANPALHTNCQALKDAIPCVVEDALYLAIECFDKSRKGQPLLPLNSLGGYTVLYCGSSPNSVAPRQIRSVSPFKDISDWSRPSGTAPSSRRHSPPRNLPRMSISNTQLACNSTGPAVSSAQAGSTKPDKKSASSSTLPTINIGTTLNKPAAGGGGSTNASRQQQQQAASQQPPQQQLARTSLTSSTSAEELKFRMTHADSGAKKSRENPNRGN